MTVHDCDREGCEGVRRRVHVERLEQGLPIGVPDSPALRRIAAIFNNPAGSASASTASSTSTGSRPRAVDRGAADGGAEPSGATSNLPDPIPSTPKRRRAASTVRASAHQPSESDEPGRLARTRAV